MAGWDGAGRVTREYRHAGLGVYYDADVGLTPVSSASLAAADYDKDGDYDLFVAGNSGGSAEATLYTYSAGNFVDSGVSLEGFGRGDAAWGDLNNDGNTDLVICGSTAGANGNPITRTYLNLGGGSFTDTDLGLPDVERCAIALGDYDEDGDLDVALSGLTSTGEITRIYTNRSLTANQPPDAPGFVSAYVDNFSRVLIIQADIASDPEGSAVTYNYYIDPPTGAHTPLYSLSETATVDNGWRKVVEDGNQGTHTFVDISRLGTGTFEIGVQAIDQTYQGSEFVTTSIALEFDALDVRAFLEGAYSGSQMEVNLSADLPTVHPFISPPWSHGLHIETVPEVDADTSGVADFFEINPTIVDWVLVRVKPDTLASWSTARAGFVRTDGKIVDLDGVNPLQTYTNDEGFIEVIHRNHASVMSDVKFLTAAGLKSHDFTVAMDKAFTEGPDPMKDLGGGAFGLFACDINADGDIQALDFNAYLVATTAGASGYQAADCNMDGDVQALDFNLYLANTLVGASSQVP
jgi:hypothetical protein